MASKIVITTGPGRNSSMQIGPDDKIYVSRYNAKYLAVINYPDVAGANCNYDPSGVYLNNGMCMLELPNFVQGCGGYNTAPSTCQASYYSYPDTVFDCHTTYFADNSTATSNIVSWSWDFGDGTNSYLQNPTHTYAANGIYNVCLTIMTGWKHE